MTVQSLKTDLALLGLRVTFGGLMGYQHGWGKLQRYLEGSTKFADPIGLGEPASLLLAALAESACAALVVAGVATRSALIPLVVTMAVAAFIVHGADPLAKKEMALLYLAGYTALLVLGPGRLALSRLYQPRLARLPRVVRSLLT